MWDTWMLKENGRYHLFTLTVGEGLDYWDRVCHAVSPDLLSWEDWDDIVLENREDPKAWDAGIILTGSAFAAPQGYAMTYGAICRAEDAEGKGIQRIGLLFSKDLRTWEKCPGNPVLAPRPPYYEARPQETAEPTVPWRDAYVIPVEGGFEAFVCAGNPGKTKGVNGCVGRAFSRNLIEWELLPPLVSPEKYVDMEVPQYFEWNGYHYVLFSTGAGRLDTASRAATAATYYLLGTSKEGRYEAPDDFLLIGSGDNRFDSYAARILLTEDEEPLLYHHIVGKRSAFAGPKTVRQERDGQLRLERWPGLDALLGETLVDARSPGTVAQAATGILIGNWEPAGEGMVGDAGPAVSAWVFDEPVSDCAIQLGCDLSEAVRGGVLFRLIPVAPEAPREGLKGLALCLNRARGVIQLCEARLTGRPRVQLKALETVHVNPGERTSLEVFLRAEYIEIYWGGRPCFGLSSSEYAVSGRMGFFADRGRAAFEAFAVRALPALDDRS